MEQVNTNLLLKEDSRLGKILILMLGLVLGPAVIVGLVLSAGFVASGGFAKIIAYENSKLNSKLSAEYGMEIRRSGITDIDNYGGFLSETGRVTYRDDDKLYTATIRHGMPLQMWNSWVSVNGDALIYRGEIDQFAGKPQIDFQYDKAKYLIEKAIDAVEEDKQHREKWSS